MTAAVAMFVAFLELMIKDLPVMGGHSKIASKRRSGDEASLSYAPKSFPCTLKSLSRTLNSVLFKSDGLPICRLCTVVSLSVSHQQT